METINQEKLAVTIDEAGRMIGISSRGVENFIAAKLIPVRRIGRRRVILVSSLEAFLRTDHPSPTKYVDAEQAAATAR